jgi:hypothetical protein
LDAQPAQVESDVRRISRPEGFFSLSAIEPDIPDSLLDRRNSITLKSVATFALTNL